MNIIRMKNPGELQKNNLLLLQETCQKHDRLSLTFPMEEDCVYYLLYDEDSLLSALCAFFNENGDCECCAFTRPEKRRLGYFTLLLNEFLKEADDCDLIFPIDESCPDTVRTLEAMGTFFWYSEHIMELASTAILETKPLKRNSLCDELTVSAASGPVTGPTQYMFFMNDSPIGSCYLDSREQAAYFYGFEIAENLRGKGLGNACFSLFLETLFSQPAEKKPKKLFLQVSGQNKPAMAIYQKAGFKITESLSYYVY
ncbi:GNAT family N-acetyltransferase [Clostridium sp. Marseille-P2415]|uniref:GNAT family N-acetyltransferase n=1 Tax=Clostridium sp. Marseille-P2415 TaxID=1805471 RepID=UPI0009884BCA|nr:GNAT family N-acetyltransferase [Clostridium sp. Marseille-P2415]